MTKSKECSDVSLGGFVEISDDHADGPDVFNTTLCEPISEGDDELKLLLVEFQYSAGVETSTPGTSEMSVTAYFRDKVCLDNAETPPVPLSVHLELADGNECTANKVTDEQTDGFVTEGKSDCEMLNSTTPPIEEKEAVIVTSLQEQIALKSQISHLNDIMRVFPKSSTERRFGANADENTYFDDHGSTLMSGEKLQDCRSICSSRASGCKRGRRMSRRSSTSRHSTSLSVASKRLRNDCQENDGAGSCQIPREIEMLCQSKVHNEDNGNSCHSYESGGEERTDRGLKNEKEKKACDTSKISIDTKPRRTLQK